MKVDDGAVKSSTVYINDRIEWNNTDLKSREVLKNGENNLPCCFYNYFHVFYRHFFVKKMRERKKLRFPGHQGFS